MHCSPPVSSVHGIFQARTLEWIDIFFSRGSSWPRDWTHISCIAGRLFITELPGKPFHASGPSIILLFTIFSFSEETLLGWSMFWFPQWQAGLGPIVTVTTDTPPLGTSQETLALCPVAALYTHTHPPLSSEGSWGMGWGWAVPQPHHCSCKLA